MRTMKFYTMALLMGAALALPVAAHAEGNTANNKLSTSQFKKIDTDKSGTISESEFRAAGKSSADFVALDANKDDALSLNELQPAAGNAHSNASKDGTSAKSIDQDPYAPNDSGSGNKNRQ